MRLVPRLLTTQSPKTWAASASFCLIPSVHNKPPAYLMQKKPFSKSSTNRQLSFFSSLAASPRHAAAIAMASGQDGSNFSSASKLRNNNGNSSPNGNRKP
jgi:hypothetical protein